MSTYTPIASHTLGSATSTLMFSSIPQGYTDLVLTVSNVKHSYSGSDTVRDNVAQFNGDNGSNYSVTMLYGDGSTAGTLRSSNINAINVDYPMASASTTGHIILNIQNYSNSTTYKTVLARTATSTRASAFATLWRNTAAITSINVGASGSYTMSAGTVISLYGIQVGASTQKAQGGNIVVSDGTYMYHAFTSSGSFIPNQALTADVLVIAGGGAGGLLYAGGGGAGGISYQTGRSITTGAKTVIVGAGGAASITNPNTGASGSNSVFDTITSNGGGGGAGWISNTGTNGVAGGSGGGGSMGTASGNSTTGGAATQGSSGGATGYGNAGGGGYRGSGAAYFGGGGGGAGAVGANATSGGGGAGGAGLNTWSSWATATNTGVSGYYAGGGGGAAEGAGTAPAGGAGGGGIGQFYNTIDPTSGTANTGSGGGGVANIATPGSGGSGIVVIRYAI
jgi:hypothetical protein